MKIEFDEVVSYAEGDLDSDKTELVRQAIKERPELADFLTA